jgi:hypothetical protein
MENKRKRFIGAAIELKDTIRIKRFKPDNEDAKIIVLERDRDESVLKRYLKS